MSSRKSRRTFWRRERRKMKASGYTRGAKRNPRKHGHGPN